MVSLESFRIGEATRMDTSNINAVAPYVADRLRGLGLPVYTKVVEGDPAPRIIARTA